MKKAIVALLAGAMLLGTSLYACDQKNKGMGADKMHKCGCQLKGLKKKAIRAVSKTGLNSEQLKKVQEAIDDYDIEKMDVKALNVFPVDAFQNGTFDADKFVAVADAKHDKMVGLKVKLIKDIYAVLTKEQRVVFERSLLAPYISQSLKANCGFKACGGKMKKGCR